MPAHACKTAEARALTDEVHPSGGASRPLVVVIARAQTSGPLLLFLADCGYRTVRAASVGAALRALGGRRADIGAILADQELGEGGGGEAVIHQLAELGVIAPGLVLTSSFRRPDRNPRAPVGPSALETPVRPERLEAWLRANVKTPMRGTSLE